MAKNRAKLETAVEKEVYKLIREVKEHTFDFTMLYIRRNKLNVDGEVLRAVLEIVDKAIIDGYQKNIDRFMKGLDATLAEYSDEENPFPSSEE